jgi:predicted NACHT family NTPase
MKKAAGKQQRGHGNSRAPERAPDLRGLAYLAEAAKVQDDETTKNLLRAAAYSGDQGIIQDAVDYLGARAIEAIVEPDPFAPPLPPEDAYGELELGTIRNSRCTFGLKLGEAVQYILAIGRPGSGKTTALRRLAKQIVKLSRQFVNGPRIIVFDIKRDYL